MSSNSGKDDHISLRLLSEEDAADYRELRLEGLKNNPQSFGTSYEEEADKPVSWFAERSKGAIVFGGFKSTTLVGIAGLYVRTEIKLCHKGVLFGMFIKPEFRGRGLAKRLVKNVIEHAKPIVEEIILTVGATNNSALNLYEGLGFTVYGKEPRAMKIGEDYHNELLLRLPLNEKK